jgi:hypothetical protein
MTMIEDATPPFAASHFALTNAIFLKALLDGCCDVAGRDNTGQQTAINQPVYSTLADLLDPIEVLDGSYRYLASHKWWPSKPSMF